MSELRIGSELDCSLGQLERIFDMPPISDLVAGQKAEKSEGAEGIKCRETGDCGSVRLRTVVDQRVKKFE